MSFISVAVLMMLVNYTVSHTSQNHLNSLVLGTVSHWGRLPLGLSEATKYNMCVELLTTASSLNWCFLFIYFCLACSVVDVRQQAVDEMMQRIKKGIQLRPVSQSPNRTRTQVSSMSRQSPYWSVTPTWSVTQISNNSNASSYYFSYDAVLIHSTQLTLLIC